MSTDFGSPSASKTSFLLRFTSVAANPNDYMSSTLASCCNTYFGWNYNVCMGLLPGFCARALFYPVSLSGHEMTVCFFRSLKSNLERISN